MTYVTSAGLQIKTLETIVAELAAQQRTDIDAGLDTEADSLIGQLNGIYASHLREAWETLAIAYNSFDPDASEHTQLDHICALTGTNRHAATKGTVTCTCDLDLGTTLVAGTHFAAVTDEPENRWTPTEDYTASADGPQDVDFEAEFAGAVVANQFTIHVIATPVVGWSHVHNDLDATVGTETDTEAQLRVRREAELRAQGAATCDAIRADLLDDDDVLQVQVFENETDTYDLAGLPPHSVEVVIYAPIKTDDQIAQMLWATKGGGTRTVGTESGTATDSNGVDHVLYFSRPEPMLIYLELDLDIDQATGYAGVAAVEAAIVARGLVKLLVGRDVILNDYSAIAQGFVGVIDVTEVRVGLAPVPGQTSNFEIGIRQLALLDTGRITINENFIPCP